MSQPNQNKSSDNEKLLDWVLSQVAKAQADGFYGKLSISLEGGKITRIVSESSIVPPKI